ncbi:MAG: PilZ domain-containing protein [Terriglobales bacterium]
MDHLSDRERRQHERFPQVFEVHARTLLSNRTTSARPKQFDGRIHNLSNGGICILSSSPLQADTFVCCDLQLFDVPVSIPTLMQVRWTTKHGNNSASYISGLQFVV